MRIHKAMTAAVFGIAAAILAAPSAMATPPGSYMAIGIQDKEIRAGQKVLVVASCSVPGFAFERSKVVSPVLDVPDLVVLPDYVRSPVSSLGRVKPGTKPGNYSLSFTCNGTKVTGKFEVLPDKKKTPVKKPAGQVQVKPKGAAETGGGIS